MLLRKLVLGVLMVTLLVGCANMSESQRSTATGTAAGTGIGAAAGAIIGAIAGDPGLGAGIGAGVGAVGGYIWSSHMEKQKQQMEQVTAGTGIEVTQTQNNQLKMNVPGDFSFDTGKADIKPEMQPVLNSMVAGLKSNPNSQVNIIGHTDNTGSDAVNNPLSVNRAASTRSYIVSQGVAMNRLHIDGRGSNEPVAPNDNASNRAKNRRVEILMFEPPQAQIQPAPPQLPQQQPVNYPSQPGTY
ncbi:MAG: OmpA family protein [Nitrosomonas sp.]|nr:OmpA family protein [Nitrosomonas sp.]